MHPDYPSSTDDESQSPCIAIRRGCVEICLTSTSLRINGRKSPDEWDRSCTDADSTRSPVKTEIYMMYDDENLYVGAICYSTGSEYIITSLKRDFRAGGNDNITFLK